MVSQSSLLFQSGIATTFCNLNSDSRDAHSAHKRTEGWTEIWGDPQNLVDESEDCWQLEQDQVASQLESDILPDTPSLTILQYRPAWLEQLVLRIAGIPHIVVNTSYASNESTGPLPVLRDAQATVLVGRTQPRLRAPHIEITDDEFNPKAPNDPVAMAHLDVGLENDILGYLKTGLGVDLNKIFQNTNDNSSKELHAKSTLFSLLINTKLKKSLLVLRYEDRDAWDQIYKKQCWDCSRQGQSSDPTNDANASSKRRLPTLRGIYQAWSERVLVRKMLRSFERGTPSIDQAKLEARKAYELLEEQLQLFHKDNNSPYYLLGTDQPALVDAILWDHLADALSDINLVVILADFPLLVKYFQRIHDAYFATKGATQLDWKVWNQCLNQMNAFQQIPLEADLKQPKDASSSGFQHALELMQSLSVRDHDLLEILQVGKAAREKTLTTPQPPKPMPRINDNKEAEKPSAAEIMQRQQERSDQYWVSVMLGTALVVGLSIVGAYEQ